MARTTLARIALGAIGITNVALVLSTSHRTLAGILTMIVCGGAVVLSYVEDPNSFHQPVSRNMVIRGILDIFVGLGVIVLYRILY